MYEDVKIEYTKNNKIHYEKDQFSIFSSGNN